MSFWKRLFDGRKQRVEFDQYDTAPLDDCNALFDELEIPPRSAVYWRWHTDEGFRVVDIVDVLAESPRRIGLDWRGSPDEILAELIAQLTAIGYGAAFQIHGSNYTLSIGNESARVPTDSGNMKFAESILNLVNGALSPTFLYVADKHYKNADSYTFTLFRTAGWNELQQNSPLLMNALFELIEPSSS